MPVFGYVGLAHTPLLTQDKYNKLTSAEDTGVYALM